MTIEDALPSALSWIFVDIFSCEHSTFSTIQNPVPFLEPGAQYTSGMN